MEYHDIYYELEVIGLLVPFYTRVVFHLCKECFLYSQGYFQDLGEAWEHAGQDDHSSGS